MSQYSEKQFLRKMKFLLWFCESRSHVWLLNEEMLLFTSFISMRTCCLCPRQQYGCQTRKHGCCWFLKHDFLIFLENVYLLTIGKQAGNYMTPDIFDYILMLCWLNWQIMNQMTAEELACIHFTITQRLQYYKREFFWDFYIPDTQKLLDHTNQQKNQWILTVVLYIFSFWDELREIKIVTRVSFIWQS